jgi:hypothetical protein
MTRCSLLLTAIAIAIAGCNASVYVRDAVTDGDTFYLAPQAYADDDAVLQSWVTYSLSRSTCQLAVGGENPARVSTYDCELRAREHLLDSWKGRREDEDPYLDTLLAVSDAGFLEEYVVHYLGRDSWQIPADLDADAFRDWRRSKLKRHTPKTRLIGSWGYRHTGSY